MAITRYALRGPATAPWRDLEEVSNRLSRFFDEPQRGGWTPAVNVEETQDELVITAELPGMTHEHISIEVENNVLTLSGEKNEQRVENDGERRFHVWERRSGGFLRSFTLPRTVNADDINATFENGVLSIHLPKAPEAKPRRIEIQPSSS